VCPGETRSCWGTGANDAARVNSLARDGHGVVGGATYPRKSSGGFACGGDIVGLGLDRSRSSDDRRLRANGRRTVLRRATSGRGRAAMMPVGAVRIRPTPARASCPRRPTQVCLATTGDLAVPLHPTDTGDVLARSLLGAAPGSTHRRPPAQPSRLGRSRALHAGHAALFAILYVTSPTRPWPRRPRFSRGVSRHGPSRRRVSRRARDIDFSR
jgi:hypothetical protein